MWPLSLSAGKSQARLAAAGRDVVARLVQGRVREPGEIVVADRPQDVLDATGLDA